MATIETVLLSDLEIYRAVQAATCRYDDDAALHAAQRADELMVEGDMEGRAVWHRRPRRPPGSPQDAFGRAARPQVSPRRA